jgi:hypothetical protein
MKLKIIYVKIIEIIFIKFINILEKESLII